MDETTTYGYVLGLESFDFIVALAFPPHPSAVAPSAELGAHGVLSPLGRKKVNQYWGELKQSHNLVSKSKK